MRQILTTNEVAVHLQIPHGASEIDDVLDCRSIGNEMVVLEVLFLFDRVDGVDHTLAAEVQPLGEAVVLLHLVGRRGDLLPQLVVVQYLQANSLPNYTPSFTTP